MRLVLLVLFVVLGYTTLIGCGCIESWLDVPVVEANISLYRHENFGGNFNIVFHGELIDRRVETNEYNDPHGRRREETTVQYFQLLPPFLDEKRGLIEVRSYYKDDPCEYFEPIGSRVIMTASLWNREIAHTSKCHRSAYKVGQPLQYKRYLKLLNSIVEGEDGKYKIYQTAYPKRNSEVFRNDSTLALVYQIKNGELHGIFQIFDRKGILIEDGRFSKGKRVGTWTIKPEYYDLDTYERTYEDIFYRCRKGECLLVE